MAKAKKLSFFRFFLVFIGLAVLMGGAPAGAKPSQGPGNRVDGTLKVLAGSESMAQGLSDAVGTAISPFLIVFGHGLYSYLQDDGATERPWHAHPYVLGALGLLLALIFFKDTILSLVPILKTPLDALEESLMPGGAIIGYIWVLPLLLNAFSALGAEAVQAAASFFQASPAWAQEAAAGGHVSALSAKIGAVLTAACGAVIYAVVWLVSNALNVLCILAPGPVGLMLKTVRLTVVGALYGLAYLNPFLGLAAALLVIVLSVILLRWSFKMTVWGGLFAFHLLTRRWRSARPGEKMLAFGGSGARERLKIPKRTIGFLRADNGRLIFSYRFLLLFPRQVELPPTEKLHIGRCLSAPQIMLGEGRSAAVLLTFPLSYHGHEEFLAEKLGIKEIRDAGLRTLGAREWLGNMWRRKNLGECAA